MAPQDQTPTTQATEPPPPFPAQHQDHPGLEQAMDPAPRYEGERYRPAQKLQGQVALITGGDSGIGRAVAVLYAREGADCAIAYLAEERADAEVTRAAVERAGRRCVLLEGDLTDPRFCQEAVERTVSELGKLTVLVSNAAYQNRVDDVLALTDEEIERTYRTNVYAYLRLVRAALPHLPHGGAIIATASIQGLEPSANLIAYASTKAAIISITRSLAKSLAEKGIRVNAVAPGPVWTPLNVADQGAPPEKVATFGASSPRGRPAQPEEIAPAYVYLASEPDSSFVSGTVIVQSMGET